MNNELEKALAEAVQKGIKVAEQTGQFVIDQAPELLREFYMWHYWSAVFMIGVGLILILAPTLITRLFLRKEEDEGWDIAFFGRYVGESFGILLYVIYGSAAVIGFCFICSNTYDLIYMTVAPKLYLIDYFL